MQYILLSKSEEQQKVGHSRSRQWSSSDREVSEQPTPTSLTSERNSLFWSTLWSIHKRTFDIGKLGHESPLRHHLISANGFVWGTCHQLVFPSTSRLWVCQTVPTTYLHGDCVQIVAPCIPGQSPLPPSLWVPGLVLLDACGGCDLIQRLCMMLTSMSHCFETSVIIIVLNFGLTTATL